MKRANRLQQRLALWTALGVAVSMGAPFVSQAPIVAAAHAKKKRKKRRKKAKKAPAPKKADAKKSDEDLRAGPAAIALPFSEKEFENTARADKKRDEAIKEIQSLLSKVKGARKAELVFRLAELYWEKSRFVYQKEFAKFDVAFSKWDEEGRQGSEPQLEAYTKKSEAYKKQALKNYQVVLDEYPTYPRLDQVLYIMAYNEYAAGKKKRAIKNYSKLIRQFKDSDYVADSYLALGEHYFGANNLSKAQKAYKKAYKSGKKKRKASVYIYALYKLAWCDFNSQSFDAALKKFKRVIASSEKAEARAKKTGGSQDAVRLKRESLRDMVRTYAQIGEVESAYKYFKTKTDRDHAFNLTEKLARVYNAQGGSDKEIETYRLLLNLDPDVPQAPDYQSSIVAAYSKLEDRKAVRREVSRLVELYRPGSPWWRKNEDKKAIVDRARTIAEDRMRNLVTDYHQYAQKFKRVDDYQLARDIYAEYLKAFNDSESAYRLQFFYAEILFDLGEWEKAARAYDATVERDPKGEYTKNAAWAAILSWEKIVKKVPPPEFKNGKVVARKNKKKRRDGKVSDVRQIEEIQKGRTYEKKKIPEAQVALAAACDRYVNVVKNPKNDKKLMEELIVVKFKAGYIYQDHYHFDEAAKRFGELIERWPTSKFARQGADLILDSYGAREDWNNLEKWSRTFAKNKPLMKDAAFAKSVRKFMEGASFKSIAMVNDEAGKLEKAGKKDEARTKFAEAASRFEAFVDEFPKSEFAPFALFNSTLIYKNAQQIDLAIRASEKLLGKYRKELGEGKNLENRLEEISLLNLATYYEQVADYPKSAARYVEFVDKFKEHKEAPNALYNAGLFNFGLGKTKDAVKLFSRYITEFSKQKDIPAVYLRMASIFEDQEQWKKAATLFGDFERKFGKSATKLQVMDAKYRFAHALLKSGQKKALLNACADVLKDFDAADDKLKKNPTVQTAGGFCAFQSIEPARADYEAVNLEVKFNKLKGALETKRRKMNEVGKRYVDVLKYGSGEWGVAGLLRAAEVQLEYVRALREMPDPPALANNFEAIDIFRAQLEDLVFPVEEGAIVALEQALAKAFELGIYSEYTLAIEERLKEFKPAEFGELRSLPFYDGPNSEMKGGDA